MLTPGGLVLESASFLYVIGGCVELGGWEASGRSAAGSTGAEENSPMDPKP